MAEQTGIAWCDSTFNPWIGCTKIGLGCDHCYAEAQDGRKRWGGTTHWGAGVARYRTSASNWAQPLRWNKAAEKSGKVHRVFCASLADVFDNEVPAIWRHDLWKLILNTPHLSWLLVTKRIGNVEKMWPVMQDTAPPNVRILITVCNQEEADRDIPKLLALNCKNGISYEPALGPVDFERWLEPTGVTCMDVCPDSKYVLDHEVETTSSDGETIPFCPHCGLAASWTGYDRGLDWIIVGGESGPNARPFDVVWARATIKQCKAAGVPVFCKQVGSNPVWGDESSSLGRALREGGYTLKDRAGADPAEWPEDLRVREFPV